MPSPAPVKPGTLRAEQIILFRIGEQLCALSSSSVHEERQWYRGLTAVDQMVVPVVRPEGFLSDEELTMLDRAVPPAEASREETERELEAEAPTDTNLGTELN